MHQIVTNLGLVCLLGAIPKMNYQMVHDPGF